MNVSELVVALQNSKGPDRKLDAEIAKLVGFTKSTDKKKSVWRKPDGTTGNPPGYTRLVDYAIELANFIAPDNVGGCSWEKDRGTAKINSGPYVHGANPAIALCVAALQILWLRQDDEPKVINRPDQRN